jgi:hypothetical protein
VLSLHRRQRHPCPAPALFILLPQEGQSGGRVAISGASQATSIFSRLILPPLAEPATLTLSPGRNCRTVSLNPFVGS